MAEAYRSRTYRWVLAHPLDLKSRRHTGDETLPTCSEYLTDPLVWSKGRRLHFSLLDPVHANDTLISSQDFAKLDWLHCLI